MQSLSSKYNIFLSIITPVYNEEENLNIIHERLVSVLTDLKIKFEWIIVDDHSTDSSFGIIKSIARKNENVFGIRLSKNYGSHKAILSGLRESKGQIAVVLASDLQDPPEIIPEMIHKWKSGSQIIWAVRNKRIGESFLTNLFSLFYYWIMRKIVGVKDLPSKGADFFLIDRKIIESLKLFTETNLNIFSLLTWMGFKQDSIYYDKQARLHGKSGWTVRKKIKLLFDSIASFSHFPIRIMTYFGFIIAFIGFVYSVFTFNNALSGIPIPGWSSIIIIITFLGGFQIVMIGVVGEYLWRVLDESRKRPTFLIEDNTKWSVEK